MKSLVTKRPDKALKSRRTRASAILRSAAAAGAIVVTLATASYFLRSCSCGQDTLQQKAEDRETARF